MNNQQTDYKHKCLDIYYASDVVDKKVKRGLIFTSKYNRNLRIEFTHRSTTTGRMNPGRHWHGHLLNQGSKDRRCKFPVDSCEVIGHPPTLVDWAQLLNQKTDGNWFVKPMQNASHELVNMDGHGTKKFANQYLVFVHENFYERLYNIIK